MIFSVCDAAHEKVPIGRNGVISMVVQRTYQGIQQNKNHSKIPSTFRDIDFYWKNFNKNIYTKLEKIYP